jgi:hypothetical protein
MSHNYKTLPRAVKNVIELKKESWELSGNKFKSSFNYLNPASRSSKVVNSLLGLNRTSQTITCKIVQGSIQPIKNIRSSNFSEKIIKNLPFICNI